MALDIGYNINLENLHIFRNYEQNIEHSHLNHFLPNLKGTHNYYHHYLKQKVINSKHIL